MAGGWRTTARPLLPSPPHSPSGLRATGAPALHPPPEAERRPLSLRRGRGVRGGTRLSLHVSRPHAPHRLLLRLRDRRANPRQGTGTTHGPRPGAAREHEPEQYGGHTLHDLSIANDTCFVARPGKVEGRTEAERPPALLGPPATPRGRVAHRSPLPPSPRQADPPAAGRAQGCPATPAEHVHLWGMRR